MEAGTARKFQFRQTPPKTFRKSQPHTAPDIPKHQTLPEPDNFPISANAAENL